MEKPWTNKEFLYERYSVKRMTIDDISAECKKLGYPVTSMTIYNHLKKFDLIRNSRNLGKRSYGKKQTVGPNTSKKKGYYG